MLNVTRVSGVTRTGSNGYAKFSTVPTNRTPAVIIFILFTIDYVSFSDRAAVRTRPTAGRSGRGHADVQQQFRWIHRNCDGIRKNNGVTKQTLGRIMTGVLSPAPHAPGIDMDEVGPGVIPHTPRFQGQRGITQLWEFAAG